MIKIEITPHLKETLSSDDFVFCYTKYLNKGQHFYLLSKYELNEDILNNVNKLEDPKLIVQGLNTIIKDFKIVVVDLQTGGRSTYEENGNIRLRSVMNFA